MEKELYDQIQRIERTHWWYVARRRIIFDWVLRILADYRAPRVLDVGCGTGFNIEQLRTRGYRDVIGLDISLKALNYCQSRHLDNLICGDSTFPPLRQESFDVIMALDLIEHLDDDTQALRAFTRLLKRGGTLVIFVPALRFLWGFQDEVAHHRRRYTAAELRGKLTQAGLHPIKLTYANLFLFPLIWSGRIALRMFGNRVRATSENDLHPGWSNGLLQAIFAAERPFLRYVNFPLGVSILCVARKLAGGHNLHGI